MSIPASPQPDASIGQCVADCHDAGAADLETAALARDRIERLESVHGDSAIPLIELATQPNRPAEPSESASRSVPGSAPVRGVPLEPPTGEHPSGPWANGDSVRVAAAIALGKVRCAIDDSQIERLQAGLRNDPSGDVRETLIETLVNLADAMTPARQSMLALMMSEIAAGGQGGPLDRSPREIRLATIASNRIRAIVQSENSSRTREAG